MTSSYGVCNINFPFFQIRKTKAKPSSSPHCSELTVELDRNIYKDPGLISSLSLRLVLSWLPELLFPLLARDFSLPLPTGINPLIISHYGKGIKLQSHLSDSPHSFLVQRKSPKKVILYQSLFFFTFHFISFHQNNRIWKCYSHMIEY